MFTTTDTARPGGIRTTFRRVDAWLDARGKWAWIAAMVAGFILFWPVGLALLAYMIWGKQMFSRSRHHRHDHHSHDHHQSRSMSNRGWCGGQMTGNVAFDSYKAEALRRLEDEQQAFEAFLQRLRNSKDKSEFDAFMEDRARTNAEADAAEANAVTTTDVKPADVKPADGNRPGEY